VLLLASAVLAWRAAHGVWPKTPGPAIGAVPADPFDGRPLRYRREPQGFVIYSVGPSGRFDGGTTRVRPSPKEILFRYPLPTYLK
jgi:hypothetical protein